MFDKIKGYKTYTSAGIVAVVAILKYLGLIDDGTAKLLFELAAAAGLYALRDALNGDVATTKK